ncbi:hypothetical protein FIM12_04620 [SAR202 cluster bacterium AD-804-J14_MRT_500m]|nr:hypothetical protein [SAR202 cluster bacterium AD-804-J14_MRT_500m]
MKLLALTLGFLLLVASACGGDMKEADTPVSNLSDDPELDIRFSDSVTEYVENNWATWERGQQVGECLITNSATLTKKSKEAVIEHGIDEAFDRVSGTHSQSLSTVWDLCKTESETSAPSSSESADATNTKPNQKTPLTPPPPSTPGSRYVPSPTPTPGPIPELGITCSVDQAEREVQCQANQDPEGGDLNWTTNASSQHGGGSVFTFIVSEIVPEINVKFEACINDSCKTVTTTIDAPELLQSVRSDFSGKRCTTASNPQPIFTHHVIPLELLTFVIPPGTAASGMLKPHAYLIGPGGEGLFGDKPWSGYPRSVPVTVPVTSWLVEVGAYRSTAYGTNAPEPPIEYMLIFEVSCEVYFKLDHTAPLVDKIEALGPFPVGSNTQLKMPTKFEAGELVTYSSGVNPGGNVDFGVYNTTIERTFGNQDRYANGHHDQSLNEDCPFDYFTPELREKHYALIGDESTRQILVGTKRCRVSADSDVPGTIKGAWFMPGGNIGGAWGIHESVFSISTSHEAHWVRATFAEHPETGGEFEIIVAPEDATYIGPSKVTDEHCYESYTKYHEKKDPVYLHVKLTTSTDLRLEHGTGSCANRTSVETLLLVR